MCKGGFSFFLCVAGFLGDANLNRGGLLDLDSMSAVWGSSCPARCTRAHRVLCGNCCKMRMIAFTTKSRNCWLNRPVKIYGILVCTSSVWWVGEHPKLSKRASKCSQGAFRRSFTEASQIKVYLSKTTEKYWKIDPTPCSCLRGSSTTKRVSPLRMSRHFAVPGLKLIFPGFFTLLIVRFQG